MQQHLKSDKRKKKRCKKDVFIQTKTGRIGCQQIHITENTKRIQAEE